MKEEMTDYLCFSPPRILRLKRYSLTFGNAAPLVFKLFCVVRLYTRKYHLCCYIALAGRPGVLTRLYFWQKCECDTLTISPSLLLL